MRYDSLAAKNEQSLPSILRAGFVICYRCLRYQAELSKGIPNAYALLFAFSQVDIKAAQLIHKVQGGTLQVVWHPSTIAYILTNISYTGDMLWKKSYATNEIPFRQVQNNGEKPKYFVENCHEAIISKDDFRRVQILLESRGNQAGGTVSSALLAKKIYCGNCGTLFRRKIVNEKVYWTCRKHDRDKDCCSISQILEEQVITAIVRMYHKLKMHREQILSPILSQLTE